MKYIKRRARVHRGAQLRDRRETCLYQNMAIDDTLKIIGMSVHTFLFGILSEPQDD